MILLLAVVIVLLFIVFSWIEVIRQWKKLDVPGPIPYPVLGNAWMFMFIHSSEFLIKLSALAVKYRDLFVFHLLADRYICISHPKYVEGVLSSNELITKGTSYTLLMPWLGEGLLTSTGSRWRTHRKFLTPAFHYNILQSFFQVFLKNQKILENKLNQLADGAPIDLFPIIALAALDNITESIMGVSVNAQKESESEYVKAVGTVCSCVALRMRNSLYFHDATFNLTKYKKKHEEAIKVLHRQTAMVIEAREKELDKLRIDSLTIAQSEDVGIRNKHAFLDLLLLAEINGKKIDRKHVREEVDTFMFEGHDTTTSAIVFCLFCLSLYPDVQEKVLNEQKDIFGNDLNRDPTYNELQEMKYLELVIKESLRIFPSVPLIQRLATQDTVVSGIHITKGTTVMINIFHMQRNPDVFEDPLEFRPERFETQTAKNAFSWVAFSAGPRNCIGQKFAMIEMKVMLSGIVKKFKLLPAKQDMKLIYDLILRTDEGVFVKIKPRY